MTVAAEGFRSGQEALLKPGGENTISIYPPGVIAGKVVDDATGQPIPAFRLRLDGTRAPRKPDDPWPGSPPMSSRREREYRSRDGTFTCFDLECPKSYAVIVQAEGYAASRVEPVVAQPADWEKWPFVIRLGKGETLSGRLVDDASGQPVGGAQVFLDLAPEPMRGFISVWSLKHPDSSGGVVEETTAGPDGRFELRASAAWKDRMLWVRAPGYAMQFLSPVKADPGTIRLARGGTIVGNVKGFPDLWPDGAFVTADNERVHLEGTRIGPDGTFRIGELAPGVWQLILFQGREWLRGARVSVAAGQTAQVDFAHLPGFTLSGRLTRSGKALEGVHVTVNSSADGAWIAKVASDADGRYAVPSLPPGGYFAEIGGLGAEPDEPQGSDKRFALIADKDAQLDFTIHTSRIQGRIVGRAGGPRSGTMLCLFRRAPQDPPPDQDLSFWRAPSGEFVFLLRSPLPRDADVLGLRATRFLGPERYVECGIYTASGDGGEFATGGLAPGEYVLLVAEPDSKIPRFVTGIRIERDGETVKVDARPECDGALRVRVVDSETQRPIPKARLIVCMAGGLEVALRPLPPDPRRPWDSGEGKSDGLFSLDGLQRMGYGVWVSAPGYGARFVSPVLAAEKPAETVIRLERTGALVFNVAPDLLKGLAFPCLLYCVRDGAGRAVYPGGDWVQGPPIETGVFKLFGDGPPERRTDLIPPGRYTLEWEIHHYPRLADPQAPEPVPASASGKAEFEIRKGEETVVHLARPKPD